VNTGALGVYTIKYLKVDTSGNTGSVTRTITVTDQTAPIITLSGSSIVNILQSGSYTELGATWADNIDGSGTIIVATSGSVNTSVIGTYTLTYHKIDAAGNTGSTTRTVVVHTPDITRPIVTLVGSGTQVVHSGSIYTDPGASWTDNIDGSGNTLVGTYGNTGSFQSTGSVNTNQT
jgi:hypothetical protein